MREESKEIIKLTAKELFFSIFDLPIALLVGGLDMGKTTIRRSVSDYFNRREVDRSQLSQQIYYLKKTGLIRTFIEGKETYLELTKKGYRQVSWRGIENHELPSKWDGRFRLVIFDIPEEKRYLREVIRLKLEKIGFIQVQKSVYIYPFECKEEINLICYFTSAKKYLKYMIADIIEGEEEIIGRFLDRAVLNDNHLNNIKKTATAEKLTQFQQNKR